MKLQNRKKKQRRPQRFQMENLERRDLMTTTVFDDALGENWQNYSWETELEFGHAVNVASGEAAIAATYGNGWAGVYLSLPEGQTVDAGEKLSFKIHGGDSSDKDIALYLVNDTGDWLGGGVVEPIANAWTTVTIPIASVGNPQRLSGIVWQEYAGSSQSEFYLDDIQLDGESTDPTDTPTNPGSDDFTIVKNVYDESPEAGWQDWSWGTAVNLDYQGQAKSGQSSISAKHNEAWSGMYLRSLDPISSGSFDEVHFSIHGGAGGQTISFAVVNGAGDLLTIDTITPTANQWTDVRVDLAELGSPSQISGMIWQEFSGNGNQNTYFIDDVYFASTSGETDPGNENRGPTITIDPNTVIREISDQIYGINFVDDALARDIDLPVERWGGNSTTRYNYQVDASNRGSDWFFENHPDDNANPELLPVGSSLDRFIQNDVSSGAETVVTVGTIGWTAKDRNIVGGFSVDKYGTQQSVDPWREYGNGVRPDGSFITGNDPLDTSIPIDEEFTRGLVEHLVDQFGTADEGGVQYYALDNEPMLWNSTHRDVHPEPASYDEVLQRGVVNALAIKDVDPSAQVLGPTSWGWTGYFYSALDVAGEGAWWNNPLDRNSHGGQPFIPWYLEEMADAEAETGERLLDYLDIHYYPQNDGVTLTTEPGSLATQRTRLESTRSLWDPTYVDKTWINEEVQLIPRMRGWIDQYYPDTKLAITEYNFGATGHINGAVTQADVLGIFGREGVDLATMWSAPDSDDPAAYAFRMFRNYDGEGDEGSRFGDTSVSATTTNSEAVSVFAAQRDVDDALTIMLINKSSEDLVTPVELPKGFDGLQAEVYTYDASNLDSIVRGDDVAVQDGASNSMLDVTLLGNSITLLELPPVGFVSTELPANVVSLERNEAPDEFTQLSVTFDGDALDAELSLNHNGLLIDVADVAPDWNAETQVVTWDLSSLDLKPGRYQVSVETSPLTSHQDEILVAYRGDTDRDGTVGFSDFLALASKFGKSGAEWSDGDTNNDGEITFADFLDMAGNFGKSVDAAFAEM